MATGSSTHTRVDQNSDTYTSRALGNAAATVNTNILDLGSATPFAVTDVIHVSIATSAASGANNKNINVRIQDSADNNGDNFANVALLANPVLRVTDNNGAGYSASSVVIALPPNIKRYVRAVAVTEANGGAAADGTITLKVLL